MSSKAKLNAELPVRCKHLCSTKAKKNRSGGYNGAQTKWQSVVCRESRKNRDSSFLSACCKLTWALRLADYLFSHSMDLLYKAYSAVLKAVHVILEHMSKIWNKKCRQIRWRPEVGKRETPESLENSPCEKSWGNKWFFGLNGLFKTAEKKKITLRVAILMRYTEYLAWAAHTSQFLVAKPVLCLMSCG